MKYTVFTDPSKKLQHTALMRDYNVVKTEDSTTIIAVGDMANNLVGQTSYQDADTATGLGLDATVDLNGGLIGSYVLRTEMVNVSDHGTAVIKAANKALRTAYARLGLADDLDAAERFTGYLLHAVINPEVTYLTSLGDVYAWVNGDLVAGQEKEIDIIKTQFIDELAARHDALTEQVATFAKQVQLDEVTHQELLKALEKSIADEPTFTRQTVYMPVDTIVTPWQIRVLQNNANHPLGYGAIDGTETPEGFIQVVTIRTEDIETLVIATDGSKQKNAEVLGIDDLEAVNPMYCEQTVLTAHPNA